MSSLKKLVLLINRTNKKRGYKQITFATGRIKRMRKGKSKCNEIKRRLQNTNVICKLLSWHRMIYGITRWNRH